VKAERAASRLADRKNQEWHYTYQVDASFLIVASIRPIFF
jgi:hypothetical protein